MSGECIKCERDSYDKVCWSCEKIEKLEQEKKKLRECVEFYADESTYDWIDWENRKEPIHSDEGKLARETLKTIKE